MRRVRRKRNWKHRLFKFAVIACVGSAGLGALGFGGAYLYLVPSLPDIDILEEISFSVPLRVYSSDNKLMAEYGQKKRTPISYENLPEDLVNAFIAAEDSRFFEHGGVDIRGLARAVFHLIKTGRKGQGGSTITMQVARNFFLSRKKTYLRKLNEIFLAWKIEGKLSKEKIIELYLNKIYLGKRAYGVAAAGEVYYGKKIGELTLAEMAMIAGLPKAPSRYNPIINPRRALLRRAYVLRRMFELELIGKQAYQEAKDEIDKASVYAKQFDVEASYLAEMVRNKMVKQYGEFAYRSGMKVYTTIDSRLQKAANIAMRNTLAAYDRRHGYRGPIEHFEFDESFIVDETFLNTEIDDDTFSQLDNALSDYKSIASLRPALVVGLKTETSDDGTEKGGSAIVFQPKYAEFQVIPWEGMSWAKPFVDRNIIGAAPTTVAQVLTPGDVIYMEKAKGKNERIWRLAQSPEVEGALVSLDPSTGKIVALVGGYDFHRAKFNHVTQAKRQPGSNFKPFIYSAALEKCFTPATIINDAPIVIQDSDGNPWRPQNDNGKFRGPLRLRVALTKSVNLVSIRILRAIGIPYAIKYAARFGIDPATLPRNLTLALGTASVTPMDLVKGYAIFANGGYSVESYFIERIVDASGRLIFIAPKVILEDDLPKRRSSFEIVADLNESQLLQTHLSEVDSGTMNVNGVLDSEQTGEGEDPEKMDVQQTETIAKRAITKKNVFLMTSILRDVIKFGTGRRALQLNRNDLSGKTGTTNDQVDAWFSGFNHKVVTSVWVGFDQPTTLGRSEYGGRAALPMWISYMREALKGVPQLALVQPQGISTIRIDPVTGKPAPPNTEGAIFEYFASECAPEVKAEVDEEPIEAIEPTAGELF